MSKEFFNLKYDEVPKYELLAYTISKIASIKQLVHAPSDVAYNGITPIVKWRYDKISEDTFIKLKECVERFTGNLEWVMYEYRINYIIEPKFFNELFDKIDNLEKYKKIVKEQYLDIYYQAIDDIPKLSEAIEECFNLKDKMPCMPIPPGKDI
jgi:hypothetical protein